jgi:hypothetical protein
MLEDGDDSEGDDNGDGGDFDVRYRGYKVPKF